MPHASEGSEPKARPPARENDGPAHFYVDGAVLHRDDPALDPDLIAVGHCYTTIRASAGRGLWLERHAARLERDGHNHGFAAPGPDAVRHACEALARAEFGDAEGVIRLQLGRDAAGDVHFIGVPRALGDEPDFWSMSAAPQVHPGPGERARAKLLGVPFIEAGRRWLATTSFDEAAFFDADGHLVEGTRSNLLVVLEDGRACYPAPELGAVAGIGLQVACDLIPDLRPARISRQAVDRAQEIIAVNAVRGARPVTEWNGVAVGGDGSGSFARRMATAMTEETTP